MFIPFDFWQPDRDLYKSLLTLTALLLALINVGLMRIIWVKAFGFSDKTYKRLSLIHRMFGYTAIGIMLFIAIVTCIGIIGYGGYAARPTWHSWLGISALTLIVFKIIAVRKGLPEGEKFRRYMMALFATLTVVLAILGPTVMHAKGVYVMPLFPLAGLIGMFFWKRFGYLPVMGTMLASCIAFLFISSAGWWFANEANAGPKPDVSSIMKLSGSAESGKGVFNENCGRCHCTTGFGGIGPSLRKNTFFYEFSDEKIAQQIRGGKGIMPAFNESQVSDQQVADLINFIRNWY